MNSLTIIGNLTRDPQTRSIDTANGPVTVTTFGVAVNKRGRDGQQTADFFNVHAWRGLGENCAKYLARGRKVCVVGPVSVSTYQGNDGTTRASLEVTAQQVEFLSAKGESDSTDTAPTAQAPSGFIQVDNEELPF